MTARALFNQECYVPIAKYATDLTARDIRLYYLSKKELWREIPYQARLANGRGGGWLDYYGDAYECLKLHVSVIRGSLPLRIDPMTGHLLAVLESDGVSWNDRDTYPGTLGLVMDEDFQWLKMLAEGPTWWLANDQLVLDSLLPGGLALSPEVIMHEILERQQKPYGSHEDLAKIEKVTGKWAVALSKMGFPTTANYKLI
jgi:hypothetical protein